MKGWKNNNDPWEPLQDENLEEKNSNKELNSLPSHIGVGDIDGNFSRKSTSKDTLISCQLPQNPLHNIIDSQSYLQSLERKLNRLKKKKENPSSKDIINSLALFQEDQMRNYINSDSTTMDNINETDQQYLTPSYMKRKLFPELQAINAIEVAELIKEDYAEKVFEQLSLEDTADVAENKRDEEHLKNSNVHDDDSNSGT